MRIIWREETGELSCAEVNYCSYAVDVRYWDGNADESKVASGLYFEDATGSSWVVPNVSQMDADNVTREMFRTGSCDLTTRIGTWIPYLEDDDEEEEENSDESDDE